MTKETKALQGQVREKLPEVAIEEGFALKPKNLSEALQYADLIAKSDFVPKDYAGKPGNVLVAMQYGMELGIAPMQALQNIYLVNGRPAIFGDLGLALIKGRHDFEGINETFDSEKATCIIRRRGHEIVERTFTMAMAVKAKLTEKNNSLYKQYPERMLQMRARWLAMRDQYPDVFKGIAGVEDQHVVRDMGDIQPDEDPVALLRNQIKGTENPEQWAIARDNLAKQRSEIGEAAFVELASLLNAKKAEIGLNNRTEEVKARIGAGGET